MLRTSRFIRHFSLVLDRQVFSPDETEVETSESDGETIADNKLTERLLEVSSSDTGASEKKEALEAGEETEAPEASEIPSGAKQYSSGSLADSDELSQKGTTSRASSLIVDDSYEKDQSVDDSLVTASDLYPQNIVPDTIPVPGGSSGRPNRGGYSLEKQLGFSRSDWITLHTYFKQRAERLDLSVTFTSQNSKVLKQIYDEADIQFPVLKRYQQRWASRDLLHIFHRYNVSRENRLKLRGSNVSHTQQLNNTVKSSKRKRPAKSKSPIPCDDHTVVFEIEKKPESKREAALSFLMLSLEEDSDATNRASPGSAMWQKASKSQSVKEERCRS